MLRRYASAFWLVLALLLGQQAAALHDIAHAGEPHFQKHDGKPGHPPCDENFACATFSGGLKASLPTVPEVVADNSLSPAPLELGTPAAARLAFRSRAPPTVL